MDLNEQITINNEIEKLYSLYRNFCVSIPSANKRHVIVMAYTCKGGKRGGNQKAFRQPIIFSDGFDCVTAEFCTLV